ncbi:hypothetical protein ACVWYG_003509 [Pedobacter sp. UYEF25]
MTKMKKMSKLSFFLSFLIFFSAGYLEPQAMMFGELTNIRTLLFKNIKKFKNRSIFNNMFKEDNLYFENYRSQILNQSNNHVQPSSLYLNRSIFFLRK